MENYKTAECTCQRGSLEDCDYCSHKKAWQEATNQCALVQENGFKHNVLSFEDWYSKQKIR